jgi:hypothetical protein
MAGVVDCGATAMSSHAKLAAEIGSARTLVIDFRQLLRLDPDPQKQACLRSILIEELDKLANNGERLETASGLTRKGKGLIAKGRAHLEGQNHSNAVSSNRDYHRSLELMETIQQLFENFHRRLQTIYPYSVTLRDEVVGVCATLDEARQRAQRFADANPEAVVTVADAEQGRSELFRNANKG